MEAQSALGGNPRKKGLQERFRERISVAIGGVGDVLISWLEVATSRRLQSIFVNEGARRIGEQIPNDAITSAAEVVRRFEHSVPLNPNGGRIQSSAFSEHR